MAKKKLPPEVLEYFRKQGAKGGKIGGKRSLETMTPEQRSVFVRALEPMRDSDDSRVRAHVARVRAALEPAKSLAIYAEAARSEPDQSALSGILNDFWARDRQAARGRAAAVLSRSSSSSPVRSPLL